MSQKHSNSKHSRLKKKSSQKKTFTQRSNTRRQSLGDSFLSAGQSYLERYSLALSFSPQSDVTKKVDSLRRRFDWRYEGRRPLVLTLLPPFEINGQISELVEEISDECFNFFHQSGSQIQGIDQNSSENYYVRLEGVEAVRSKRETFINLKPGHCSDLEHFSDAVLKCALDRGASFDGRSATEILKQRTSNKKSMMVIGRFSDIELLTQSMDSVLDELAFPIQVPAHELVLFKKVSGVWCRHTCLYEFSEQENDFQDSLQWESVAVNL